MSKKRKYQTQINAISTEAARIMSAPFNLLVELLDSPSPATRGACACLLHDFARGKLPPLPLKARTEIARRLEDRLSVETDPFLCELIECELAMLVALDREPPLAHLQPSRN